MILDDPRDTLTIEVGTIKHKLISAFKSHAKGHVDKHVANVEVLLDNPVGVGNNGDIIEEIEKELEEVAKYHDLLEMIDLYVSK